MRPILYLVTDRHRLEAIRQDSGPDDQLVALVHAAARAGVSLVQVRERDLDGGPLTRLVARCVEAVQGTSTRVLVNDRLDVALAAGAHGVHLPAHGVPASRVRASAPRGFLVGRSVHDPGEAIRVSAGGALDYLLFGAVFETASKPGVAAAGVQGLSAAALAVSIPVLAIGGITVGRIRDVAGSGAAGLAAIGLFADTWGPGANAVERVAADVVRAWTLAESRRM